MQGETKGLEILKQLFENLSDADKQTFLISVSQKEQVKKVSNSRKITNSLSTPKNLNSGKTGISDLDIQTFVNEACTFSQIESNHAESALLGVTDGKAIGTYLEHKFTNYLEQKYSFQLGNSANGIDFPSLKWQDGCKAFIQYLNLHRVFLMSNNIHKKKEFGDFQIPDCLAIPSLPKA